MTNQNLKPLNTNEQNKTNRNGPSTFTLYKYNNEKSTNIIYDKYGVHSTIDNNNNKISWTDVKAISTREQPKYWAESVGYVHVYI